MKRSMIAAVAVGFGLIASTASTQAASPLAGAPAAGAANAAAAQGSPVTKVWFRHGGPGFHGWHGGYRPGYRWRSGYGWLPLAIAGAVVAGTAGAYYYERDPYYYSSGPYGYGPAPYGLPAYGPAPYYDGPRY
jgi:hypothetical protein